MVPLPIRNIFLGFFLVSLLCSGKAAFSLPYPPGTGRISNSLFFDLSDVTIEDWHLFLKYADRYGFPKDSLYPDTTLQRGCFNNPQKWRQPVDGLSFRQVQLYCEWRSRFVSSIKNDTVVMTCSSPYYQKMKKADPEKLYEVIYRLPDLSDWILIGEQCKIRPVNYFNDSAVTETTKLHLRCIATYRKR